MPKNMIAVMLSAVLICVFAVSAQAAKPTKESGAQITAETNAAYANAYKRMEESSGLKGIGKPVNYTCDGSMGQGFTYVPDSKVLKQEDKEAYAKAIWNLCLDAASSAPYAKKFKDGKEMKIEHNSIADAMNKNGDFNWYYTVGEVEHRAIIYFKNDQLYFLIQ